MGSLVAAVAGEYRHGAGPDFGAARAYGWVEGESGGEAGGVDSAREGYLAFLEPSAFYSLKWKGPIRVEFTEAQRDSNRLKVAQHVNGCVGQEPETK